jgi:hypothetical protein
MSFVCLAPFCNTKKNKFKRFLSKNKKDIEKSTDILTLMRTHATVKVIKDFLFNRAQKLLLKNHKYYYLVDETTNSSGG